MNQTNDPLQLRAQIAMTAARMIAEDGADYGTARRKAAHKVLGVDKPQANLLPDNIQIEDEVRKYQALFQGPQQAARLRALRTVALDAMAGGLSPLPHRRRAQRHRGRIRRRPPAAVCRQREGGRDLPSK
jgi:hypothetical protein